MIAEVISAAASAIVSVAITIAFEVHRRRKRARARRLEAQAQQEFREAMDRAAMRSRFGLGVTTAKLSDGSTVHAYGSRDNVFALRIHPFGKRP